MPCGEHCKNIWASSDTNDYVNSGVNFVKYGVFGSGKSPDHLRKIGYPAIIAFYYFIFGGQWLIALQISQCLIFAFIYPVITLLAKELFPEISQTSISAIFLFLVLSGTYWVRSIMLLTDTMFLFFFIVGIYFGLRTFRQNRVIDLVAYV